jgi:NtrC-family two-component system response regulator AlgB
LYYRLSVIRIEIPPLRMRSEDIETLARSMLEFFCRNNRKALLGFTDEAMNALKTYSWPGNVRELRNIIERTVILCRRDRITLSDLPENIKPYDPPVCPGDLVSLAKIEELHIRRVIARTSSLQEAAGILGINQATLWRRRKLLNI